jgi:hypothetical protein
MALAPIVDARRLDLQLASRCSHLPRLSDTIADDEGMSILVTLIDVLGDVLIYLGFERCHQHPTRAFAHQCIQIELQRILLGGVRRDYAQHAAYLSLDGPQPSLVFDNQEGTPRLLHAGRSTTSGYISPRIELLELVFSGRCVLQLQLHLSGSAPL